MKVNGIELIQMIKDGKIKDGTEIIEYYLGLPTKHKMKVTKDNLIWNPGDFYVGELWDDNYTFEIIEEEKEIEEIKMIGCNMEIDLLGKKTLLPTENMQTEFIISKINELVREVNKIKKDLK